MFIAFWAMLGIALIGLVIAFGLRGVVNQQERIERDLHGPEAKAVSYLVPEGQDPAVLVAALHTAGHAAITEERGGHTHLLVGCATPVDRTSVRSVIERVHTTSSDGVAFTVGTVRFGDEG